jgi:large subunit ribosomal protein L15
MQIHELKLAKRKDKKKIGRGGKRGTYSGRGNKGQKARSGGNVDPLFEGGRSSLVERLKKLRGFKSVSAKKRNFNLNDLEKNFKEGETVSIENLVKAKLLNKIESKDGVKILGTGELKKKLSIDKAILLTVSAKEAIEKAGGKILTA